MALLITDDCAVNVSNDSARPVASVTGTVVITEGSVQAPYSRCARVPAATALHRIGAPVILVICVILLLHLGVFEPYHVPTGSMAPALVGRHFEADCPCCGFRSRSGCGVAAASCQNCGRVLAVDGEAADGDHILVNKFISWLQLPQRWEVIIVRLFGRDFVKRIVGLPGESVAIVNGDVLINGTLQRKSLGELKSLRLLTFDNNCQPADAGWKDRWRCNDEPKCRIGRTLLLDAANSPNDVVCATYRNFDINEQKCRPISDEYSYNGHNLGGTVPVYDFMVECDIVVEAGAGAVVMGICDGGSRMTIRLRTIAAQEACNLSAAPLSPGRSYRVELALVDRRLTLAIDGEQLCSRDLPFLTEREPVTSPFWFEAHGVQVRISNVRLYRDVHYTQAGRNAVGGQGVQLGVDQYFVLGDNSCNSEDSRFWPNNGAVPADRVVGKPFAVYFPSRSVSWQAFGMDWRARVPDWSRLRWLR